MREPALTVTKKDLEVQTFRAGGNGGQNQNKRDTGVRIIHRPSGAVGTARDERSQLQNKRLALYRMTQHPRFRAWVLEQLSQRSIDEIVEEKMHPSNLKVEYRDENGKWKAEQ